tara:strand:- start:444 stop:779 length:336 start_codon:yes stop_codon:yes gene_type:complete
MKILCLTGILLLTACTQASLTAGLKSESAEMMMMTFQKTLEESKSGFSRTWYNPNTITSGTVTVISSYYKNKRPCREFIATVYGINGTKNMYGDACRWKQYDWRLNLGEVF